MPAKNRDTRTSHRPAGIACAALVAAGVLVAVPALAQSDDTHWRMQARFTTLDDTQDYSTVGPLQGQGLGAFHTEGPAWTLDFEARPEASVASRTLRAGAVVTLDLAEGWGSAEVIGADRASLTDVLTVTADGDFGGGFLEFDWRLTGSMEAGVGESGFNPYDCLCSFGWEYYMKAELFVTGEGLPRTSVAQEELLRATVPAPDSGRNFTSYMPWDGAEVYGPKGQELRNRGGSSNPGAKRVRVAVVPDSPQALSFNLATGINLGLFNNDFYGVKADNTVAYWNTATLDGVRLYDADGSFYGGAWSLHSQQGIDYAMLPQVPEPATVAMWLAGLGLLGGVRARRRG